MDLRTGIAEDVYRQQKDLALAEGDLFIRDGQVVAITSEAPNELRWLTAAGEEEAGTREAFLSRALQPVTVGPPEANFIDSLWQLASAREIPGQVRAVAVQNAASRARSEMDRAIARRWASALFGGMEPLRG